MCVSFPSCRAAQVVLCPALTESSASSACCIALVFSVCRLFGFNFPAQSHIFAHMVAALVFVRTLEICDITATYSTACNDLYPGVPELKPAAGPHSCSRGDLAPPFSRKGPSPSKKPCTCSAGFPVLVKVSYLVRARPCPRAWLCARATEIERLQVAAPPGPSRPKPHQRSPARAVQGFCCL